LWVENHKSKIQEIVKHFQMYPPVRLSLQLEFLSECLRKNDLNWYMENRKYKYQDHRIVYKILESSQISLELIKSCALIIRLSGFTEGCFCSRAGSSRNCSFAIAQKVDLGQRLRRVLKASSVLVML
jgi:hypothetical protein